MNARHLVNSISLSRIPLALIFVITFKPSETLIVISFGLVIIYFVTDIFDGFLARKLNVTSMSGRQWDSLGDKSFYIAVIISFLDNGILNPLISWGLIVREVALYILRLLYIEKLPQLEDIRPYTNWHGYFMYLLIALGFVHMYGKIQGAHFELYTYIQIAALCSLLFGIGSIFKFLSLKN